MKTHRTLSRLIGIGALLAHLCMPVRLLAQEPEGDAPAFLDRFAPVEISGFVEARGGIRTQQDPNEEDESILESRVQAEFFTYSDWAELKFKGDLWGDGITEQVETDTREAWLFARPSDFVDVKIGRQVLTWGTGDLVFLNDLFPKDWQSFFIGRDMEYLKAPSDAVKISIFNDLANLDAVYTPQFDPDRHITGEYVSYWNGAAGQICGHDAMVRSERPDEWFEDDEVAVRLYRNIRNYEFALYGYWGFWKNPAGQNASGAAIFPRLNVYGASARGQAGRGIGNIELAWYHSADDNNGTDPRVRNSELRTLVGYTQDLARDFNASLQYYVEHMLDYGEYLSGLSGAPAKDRHRHVITLQLTRLLMNQNLELSLSSYYSPSDEDAYLLPKIEYKYTDRLCLQAGANIFSGSSPHTFFAQLEDNTNIYAAIRYSL